MALDRAYSGRVVRLQLDSGKQTQEELEPLLLQRVLLGSGLAAHYYRQEMAPLLDALDPASPLYVFTGLLTGTMVPTACRSSFCARSPLTGIWNESNIGGHWGAEMRAAGLDGLVLTGAAAEPVYLWVDGQVGTVELRPAGHIWGRDHWQTVEIIRGETDPRAEVAAIGPAGEAQVRFAAVMAGDAGHARAAGRGGIGAVLGSKRVKAIAVRGGQRPSYFDEAGLLARIKEDVAYIRDHARPMSEFGTAGGLVGAEKFGAMPLQNWAGGNWPEGAQRISGQRLRQEFFVKHGHCFACPIGCGKEVRATWQEEVVQGHGPEYETLCGFGGMLLNDDLPSIIALNDLCNRLGLDTISTSATIAFATEAYQRGLLSRDDTDGVELRWGDPTTAFLLVERIARRKGFGDRLAQGSRALAAELGPVAESFAPHVKGLEVAYHDPRAFPNMALNYATANRGGCHLESAGYWNSYGVAQPELGFPQAVDIGDTIGQAQVAVAFQNYAAVFNPLGLCKFLGKAEVGPAMVARWLHLALGWDVGAEDVLRTGERIFNLKRLINLRLGVSRSDDTLPYRFLHEPRPTGGAAGRLPDLPVLLHEYDRLRGWDNGQPTPSKLRELGLER